MYCARCGKETKEEARFCTECGTPILSSDTEQDNKSEFGNATNAQLGLVGAVKTTQGQSRKKLSPLLIIALVLTLSASAAFATYYAYREVFPQVQDERAETAFSEQATWNAEATTTAETITFGYSIKSLSPDDDSRRFSYPELTCDMASTVVDDLNSRMKSDVEQYYEEAQIDSIGRTYYFCCYSIEYFDKGVISLKRETCKAAPDVYSPPQETTTCETVDLISGEHIDPEQLLGLSKAELEQTTLNLIGEQMNPLSPYDDNSASFVHDAASGKIPYYYLIPEGLILHTGRYTILPWEVFIAAFDPESSQFKPGDTIKGDAIANSDTYEGYRPMPDSLSCEVELADIQSRFPAFSPVK